MERRWCSGIMQDSHSCDPGSIPGRRTFFFFFFSFLFRPVYNLSVGLFFSFSFYKCTEFCIVLNYFPLPACFYVETI